MKSLKGNTGNGQGRLIVPTLLLLMVVVAVVKVLSEFLLEQGSRRTATRAVRDEVESRNRAHAAVAAVTAVMATQKRGETAGGHQG